MDTEDPVVFGRHPVLEALKARATVQRISVATDAVGLPRELFTLAKELGVPVVRTDKDRLDYLSRGKQHQGVVAQLGARSSMLYQDWMRKLRDCGATLVLALDQVQDPQNLGALLRTAEGAGCEFVLLSAQKSCGLTSAVSKSSAGADQHLSIARTEKLGVALDELKDLGFQVLATAPGSETVYHQADLRSPTVILLGGEQRGLPPHLKRVSSTVVGLPMKGQIASLNVASTGAILLYETVRQRNQEK